MPEKISMNAKVHEIPSHDVVQLVSFSPHSWSSQLIAFATNSRVTVGSCRFEEEAPDVDGLEYTELRQFHHGSRPTALAWGPDSTLTDIPKIVRLCTAGADKKIRILFSDLKQEDTVKIASGHTDYINSLIFEPEKGEHIASASDDHTCRIWGVADGEQKACLPLTSPGMAVCWHQEDPLKIMVAEKKGIIRFFSISNQQPILSLDTGAAPLLSADWSPSNLLRVAALAGSDWFLFDTSRSSRPIDSHPVHPGGGRLIRWSKSHDHLIATMGAPGSQVRVLNAKTGQEVISADLQIANDLSWHFCVPLVAIGGDKKVIIWSADGR